MKIHLLSDLHLEFSTPSDRLGALDSDVVVLAGDIHTGAQGIAWAASVWMDRPMVYVPGNHEYYHRAYVEHRETMRQVAADYDNLHLLDRDAVVIGETLFVGTTLWTDFQYWGKGDHVKQASAMAAADRYMNDFRLINVSESAGDGVRRFTPEDSVKIHRRELAFLRRILQSDLQTLAGGFGVDCIKQRVAVTHHLPSSRSVHGRYADSELTAAFASQLDDTITLADLWLHGHTHDSCDYIVEGEHGRSVRVVCNPRGYSSFDRDVENLAFNPSMIVEI